MLSSLSSGVSGLESFQQDMDVIGNNIANINTTGFKAGTVEFADTLSNTLRGASSTSDAEQVGTGVQLTAIDNNWSQGAIESTGVPSQLAVNGNGFFEVADPSTPTDIFATRDGTFSVNSAGNLVTTGGYQVQGYTAGGTTLGSVKVNSDPAKPTVSMVSYTIDSAGNINVQQSDGTTYVSGQVLLTNVVDPQQLISEGNNLYSNLAAAGATALAVPGSSASGTGQIQGSALESSNVDLSNEMANLITAQRAFEANSKIITTTNEVLQTLVQMKQS
ncbi:MAG: flagellar hook-basal body complex protein [Verrucomicrobiota bacterium]